MTKMTTKSGFFGLKTPKNDQKQEKNNKMTKKLKTLNNLATPQGPIYNRFKMAFADWLIAYKKRNMKGDDCVIKFIKHVGELK